MKTSKRILSVLVVAVLVFGLFSMNTFAEENDRYKEVREQDLKVVEEIEKNAEKMIQQDKKFAAKHLENKGLEDVFTISSTSALGTFGDILVSTMISSGSSAFVGHAAIVSYYSNSYTVESYAKSFSPINLDGVQWYDNTWKNKSKAFLLGVKGATGTQYRSAAEFCQGKVGLPYNWNFFNKNTTTSYYCSQLVWQGWLHAGINVETGSIPNGVIAPADLVNSSNTYIISQNP